MVNDGICDIVHDWSAFKDDTGQQFYHNSKTDETSWEPPPNGAPFNQVKEKVEEERSSDAQAMATKSRDWVEYVNGDKGEPYYYKTVALETAWEKPENFGGDGLPTDIEQSSKKENQTNVSNLKEGSHVVDVLNQDNESSIFEDWVETQDDEGRTYYYNLKTEETSWNQPSAIEEKDSKKNDTISNRNVKSDDEPVKEEIDAEGDKWTEARDDEGRTYYYNTKTEETSWDRPATSDDKKKDVNTEQKDEEEEISDAAKTESDGDWVTAQDDEGRAYFYNTKTDETSWDHPAGFDNSNGEDRNAVEERKKRGEFVKKEEDKSINNKDKTSGNWVEAYDDKGRAYYYNTKTEETSWDKPAELESKVKDNKNGKASDENVSAGDWIEAKGDRRATYYYNSKTDETMWDRPAALKNMDKQDQQVEDGTTSTDIAREAIADWVETQNDEGRKYYYNAKREETTWETPGNFQTQNKNTDGLGISPVRPQSPSLGRQDEDTVPVVAGHWVEYKDEEGRFYYYNTETQQTVWDKPADFDDLEGESAEGDDRAIGSPHVRQESPDGTSSFPTEDEGKEEVMDPAEKRLEEAKEALSQSDAIMETGILSHLTEVVRSDLGNPKNAIQALSESAHGQTAVCGLLSRWLADLKAQTSASQSTTDAVAHTKRFKKSADDIREMTQVEINRIVKERFTHEGGDSILALSKSEAAFLEDMMDSNRWRKLLIDLSAANKDSALLRYCLQSISKRGYHREIARRINQSEHFPVFNAMLASELAVIGKISVSACHDHDTSISLNELVCDLRRICTSTSYTYLYGFEVLRFQIRKAKNDSLAMEENDRLLYARIIRKWERLLEFLQGDMIDASTSTGFTPLFRKRRLGVASTISDLHQRQRRRIYPNNNDSTHLIPVEVSFIHYDIKDDRRKEIESSLSSFMKKYCDGVQIDIPLLNKMLPMTQSMHEETFIGNLLVDYPIAIEALLGYLYKPGQRVGNAVLKKQCARLIALAVLASQVQTLEEARKIDPSLPESESDEANLTEMLIKGSQLCEQLENMVSFIVTTDATKTNKTKMSPGEQICNLATKCAPVSQGVAMWAREITRGTEFVSSASYASISPNIMTLVRIIYMYHPFTQDDVCQVAFQFLKHSNSEVVYQTMNSLKEQSLRLLLFLCTRGEAPSVFDQLIKLLKEPGRSSLDASLIRYFLSGLLEIASPPFSIPFIRSLINLLKAPASMDAIKATYFDKDSKERLSSIMNYLETMKSGKLDAKPLSKEDVSLINSILSIYRMAFIKY